MLIMDSKKNTWSTLQLTLTTSWLDILMSPVTIAFFGVSPVASPSMTWAMLSAILAFKLIETEPRESQKSARLGMWIKFWLGLVWSIQLPFRCLLNWIPNFPSQMNQNVPLLNMSSIAKLFDLSFGSAHGLVLTLLLQFPRLYVSFLGEPSSVSLNCSQTYSQISQEHSHSWRGVLGNWLSVAGPNVQRHLWLHWLRLWTLQGYL